MGVWKLSLPSCHIEFLPHPKLRTPRAAVVCPRRRSCTSLKWVPKIYVYVLCLFIFYYLITFDSLQLCVQLTKLSGAGAWRCLSSSSVLHKLFFCGDWWPVPNLSDITIIILIEWGEVCWYIWLHNGRFYLANSRWRWVRVSSRQESTQLPVLTNNG